MMKRVNVLLFMMVMALVVITWAGWSPAMASSPSDDTFVEESVEQEDGTVEDQWNNEESPESEPQEEWNNQENPDSEPQEDAPYKQDEAPYKN